MYHISKVYSVYNNAEKHSIDVQTSAMFKNLIHLSERTIYLNLIEIAICISIKRWKRRNKVLQSNDLVSSAQAPRTLLSAIQNVRVENYSNHPPTAATFDIWNTIRPPDQVILAREHNQWTLLNPLATECIFFHQEMNRDRDRISSSKWATTSRKLKLSAQGR